MPLPSTDGARLDMDGLATVLSILAMAIAIASLFVSWRAYRRGDARVRVRVEPETTSTYFRFEWGLEVIAVHAANCGLAGIQIDAGSRTRRHRCAYPSRPRGTQPGQLHAAGSPHRKMGHPGQIPDGRRGRSRTRPEHGWRSSIPRLRQARKWRSCPQQMANPHGPRRSVTRPAVTEPARADRQRALAAAEHPRQPPTPETSQNRRPRVGTRFNTSEQVSIPAQHNSPNRCPVTFSHVRCEGVGPDLELGRLNLHRSFGQQYARPARRSQPPGEAG